MDEKAIGSANQPEIESSVDTPSVSPMKIEPIRQPRLYWFLFLLPWAMAVAVPLIAWPSNPLGIPGHALFSTAFTTATLALFAFQVLMNRIAGVFDALWQRGVIAHPAPSPRDNAGVSLEITGRREGAEQAGFQDEKLRSFVKRTEDELNSRGQWVSALFFVVLVLVWYLGCFREQVFKSLLLFMGILAEVVIGTLIGLMAWRMVVVGVRLWLLPQQHDLVIQSSHPDKCGGLEPLGDVCLWNALIISMAGLFLGGWIAIGPSTPFRTLAEDWAPTYRVLLTVPVTLSFVSFFLPLLSTHRVMVQKKAEIKSQLNELAQIISRENRELLDAVKDMDGGEYENRLKNLESMRKVYSLNRRIPTWPINLPIVSKFVCSQAIPVLSLLGVGEPIGSMISGLLQFTG